MKWNEKRQLPLATLDLPFPRLVVLCLFSPSGHWIRLDFGSRFHPRMERGIQASVRILFHVKDTTCRTMKWVAWYYFGRLEGWFDGIERLVFLDIREFFFKLLHAGFELFVLAGLFLHILNKIGDKALVSYLEIKVSTLGASISSLSVDCFTLDWNSARFDWKAMACNDGDMVARYMAFCFSSRLNF